MISLDADYIKLGVLLKKECEARGIPYKMTDLNKHNWGDVMFTGLTGLWSGEIKGAAEALGGIDHLESQLQKQAKNCDRLSLYIYGRVEMAPDGNCYGVAPKNEQLVWESHPDSTVTRSLTRRYFRMSYLGYRTKLARFYSQYGVEVFEVPDLDSLVVQLLAQYHVANSEGSTFSRFIPEKLYVREEDKARRDFILTLMGIQGAGIGEEVADAIASVHQQRNYPYTLVALLEQLECEEIADLAPLASFPLRSGKRTIGPAAVGKLRKALGL